MKKEVVITGAGSGLGQSLAKKFSKEGAKVHLIGRTISKLEKTAENLKSYFEIHQLDIRNKEKVEKEKFPDGTKFWFEEIRDE